MKAGAEVHFLAGQLFMIEVAALAILPRMPFDHSNELNIGGRLSFPFRRALLALVVLGMIRVAFCHIPVPGMVHLDKVLGVIHVMGQSFLCLTTAYILQVQLSNVINITPGRSLINVLFVVALLTSSASALAHFIHPNLYCLEHLAEALSCYGVLQTLQTYSSVTAPHSRGQGPYLSQLVKITEYWFLITSILAFLGEAGRGSIFTKFHQQDEDHPIMVLLEAFQQNQDSGVDDWTRLLVHSVFLNSLDEMQHFGTEASTKGQPPNKAAAAAENVPEEEESLFAGHETQMSISETLRSRQIHTTTQNNV